ncbi:hypothetical protein CH291_06875 [Rhodococcus sp. 14-1411-2a]|nr:hypothetical protein CH291_06875 [Rhodococcus sp. 14-1411-2a]
MVGKLVDQQWFSWIICRPKAVPDARYAPIGSVGGGSGLTDDGTGLFTISSGSSITEDPSNAGLYLIGA